MYLLVMQDVIRREVTRCLRQAGPRKHILNIGHGVIQKTPEEGVKFFCELARQSASIHQVASHPGNCAGHFNLIALNCMQFSTCNVSYAFRSLARSRSMPAHIQPGFHGLVMTMKRVMRRITQRAAMVQCWTAATLRSSRRWAEQRWGWWDADRGQTRIVISVAGPSRSSSA